MPRPIHDLCKGLNGSGIFQVSGPPGKQQVRLKPGQPLGPEAASGTSATGNDDAVAIGAGASHVTAGENSVPAGWWHKKKGVVVRQVMAHWCPTAGAVPRGTSAMGIELQQCNSEASHSGPLLQGSRPSLVNMPST